MLLQMVGGKFIESMTVPVNSQQELNKRPIQVSENPNRHRLRPQYDFGFESSPLPFSCAYY